MPIRIAVLARDVVLFERRGGAAARAMVLQRRGRAYDPQLVDAYLGLGESPRPTSGEVSWQEYLAARAEPAGRGRRRPWTVCWRCSPTSPM